ncbi:MAG: EAL domain-containing protein, partial [Lachnospiraceae bacterium]|nr:EAL domain-containing protein [Lachnospiraceae bacterium]
PKSGTFALVLYDFDRENALRFAEKIRGRFIDEWIVEGASVFFQPLVKMTGVPEQICQDDQLYAFIENGSIEGMIMNSVNFIDEVSTGQRRLQIEMALDRAIKNDTLQVYYQPIYDVATGRIRSCEALVRMYDEELGMVSPEEFIKVAEKTGQVNFVGEIVFEKVCQFLKEYTPQKYGVDYVEVNLSTVECMNPLVPSTIRDLMNKYGVDESQISLEITESAVIHNKETMANVMDNMQRAGLSFALDDFGTGNANFSYVLDYNFDIIKIDKTFLWAADGSEENAAILEAMLQLIKGLKRKAVVEGVETEKQRDYLVSKGVEFLQGYYYSKPLPEREFIDFIRRYN